MRLDGLCLVCKEDVIAAHLKQCGKALGDVQKWFSLKGNKKHFE